MNEADGIWTSNTLTRSLLESLDQGVIGLDHQLRIMVWNPWMTAHTGLDINALRTRRLPEVFPDLPLKTFEAIKGVMRKGQPLVLSPALHSDWFPPVKARHQFVRLLPLLTEEHEVSGVLILIRDVSGPMEDEARLAARYRSLVESFSEHIFMLGRDGIFLASNNPVTRFPLRNGEKLEGKHYSDVLPDDVAEQYREQIEKVLATARQVQFEYEIPKPGGLRYHVDNLYPVFKDNTLSAIGGTCRDITEEKRLEDQLQKSRKMEAMGLMAGGVAHDLNNILSGIIGYPELLLLDLPEDSPLRNPIKTIQESGMRAADVVEDLLTIARGVATGKEVLSVNTLITEYLGSPEHRKLERIHPLTAFETELDSRLLNITGSSSHIKKILMNLVTNAAEAIEGRGTVVVSAVNRYLDEPLKGYEDVRAGEYVVLAISDDGSGISPEDLERIFEPFYTKKVMGRSGTGLGLAIVWNSMQDHGGYINVKNTERGTVFKLYFPVTREGLPPETEEILLEEYQGHGEKILVVDDEAQQREIASEILTRLGYIAETVSSGEEAILYVKKNPVDLIVLDMVMPKGINGRKTYEEIIKIRPGQKTIIASGYAKTKEVALAQELGAGRYIRKPYTLAKVGGAVKEELIKLGTDPVYSKNALTR